MSEESNLNTKMPEVSVIVPVYNVEPYLRRCIDSLINQTLENIEIILVDDGSTDGCETICDEYADNDSRIRVIHQENRGLSEARNVGIDKARADYLMFVDSDDWVEPKFCELPLTMAKKQQADIVMFQFRLFQDGKPEKQRCHFIDKGIKTQAEALELIQGAFGMAAWNKLYHRNLFRRNRYPKGKNYEDVFLTPVLVHEAKRIVYTSTVLYNYEKRPGSITTVLSAKNAQDKFDAITLTTQHLIDWGYPSLSAKYYQSSILSYVSMRWEIAELNDKCVQYFRSLKHCPSHFSIKKRFQFYMLIISPALYRLIYRVYHMLRPLLVHSTHADHT